MTDEEIELRLALLERQRKRGATASGVAPTTVATDPAPGATAVGPVIRISGRTKAPIDEKWFRTLKICSRCKQEKNVGLDFGIVRARGVEYANAWCKRCRSETSNEYRTKPRRKNSSKHNPVPLKRPRATKK
jgi:hypothetical protein